MCPQNYKPQIHLKKKQISLKEETFNYNFYMLKQEQLLSNSTNMVTKTKRKKKMIHAIV